MLREAINTSTERKTAACVLALLDTRKRIHSRGVAIVLSKMKASVEFHTFTDTKTSSYSVQSLRNQGLFVLLLVE